MKKQLLILGVCISLSISQGISFTAHASDVQEQSAQESMSGLGQGMEAPGGEMPPDDGTQDFRNGVFIGRIEEITENTIALRINAEPRFEHENGEAPGDMQGTAPDMRQGDAPEEEHSVFAGEEAITYTTQDDYTDSFEVGEIVTVRAEEGVILEISDGENFISDSDSSFVSSYYNKTQSVSVWHVISNFFRNLWTVYIG